MLDNIGKIEKAIGYTFNNKKLLELALTHTSYANEHGCESFERLEFLGDSILGFTAAKNVYSLFPKRSEGDLSKIRAGLVCEESLASFSHKMGLPKYIRLGVGEEKTGGRNKDSILSDSFEALIAAIFLDGGINAAMKWVNRVITKDCYLNFIYKDFKSMLQEKYKLSEIEYLVVQSASGFTATAYADGQKIGSGTGVSKKTAEQKAAQCALNR